MYEQSLYKVITPIKANTISRLNKAKKWKYGYNKEHDVIIISHTGAIGEVYKIQNLKIALPKQPNKLAKGNNKWEVKEYPKELSRITSAFEWREYPNNFKVDGSNNLKIKSRIAAETTFATIKFFIVMVL